MFNFFKRKGGKTEAAPATPDDARKFPNAENTKLTSVTARAQRNDTEPSEKLNTIRKDVVNLLLPDTDYNNQKSGVGAILQIMAGKRKRGKRRNARAESCRISPLKETNVLQRSNSDRKANDVAVPTQAKNITDDADFVKALVLQKYAKNNDNKEHVSLIYVNEPDLDEKKHAEALLRQIARSIDCTVDKLNEDRQMGGTDSKIDKAEPLYESIDERNSNYRNELKGELEKLMNQDDSDSVKNELESPGITKKSNLKPPKSDTEGCSDDDRSDCGKKRVTFRKHIVFDDGDQQTDEEVGSSFESLSSEDEEYLEDADDIFADNTTVINVNDKESLTIKVESPDTLKRISSDNSDSGFIEIADKSEVTDKCESESDSEDCAVSGSETEEEIIEEIIEEITEPFVIASSDPELLEEPKTLVSQESKFQSQVAALTELADDRCNEAERARDLIAAYRKEIEEKDQEIQQLKCELAAAYKESELVRQRSRSLEEELSAARTCSSNLADQLQRRNDESLRQIRAELEDALGQRAELESRVLALERDKDRLEQEKILQEQKAQEALTAAEANTTKWRAAHEAARSQAAARAERMLADCEWKMRELEKRARDAEKNNKELTATVSQLTTNPQPSPAQVAELQQLRGVVSEQQRSVQSLTLQLQKVETREEALKLEVHRLKELLEREVNSGKEKDERHKKEVQRLSAEHSSAIESLRLEHISASASGRAALERGHAERTRAALQQLRAEAQQDARSADRKLREVTARFENLKELLATKETQFERAIAEAHSKADWDIMQLRHLLDKADISYANKVEDMTEKFEKEKEMLIEEWSQKLKEVEEAAATAASEAKETLEATRLKLIAERMEQVNKLKEQHRQEMDDQWERFMTDKENCLSRMKTECRQEGEEERVKREKELLEEIAELKSQMQTQSSEYDHLALKAAACGRTLAVTEQELREALAREKELREKRSEDATKLKQAENASKDQIEHLTRKCACLRKLFDDIRAKLIARERTAEQESKAKDKELHQLRGEVARLTKILFEQNTPKLGARTRADGCETSPPDEAEPQRKGMSTCV
ncbi:golgin subfamily A member 6-like protein 22 isoform X2 [Trichoplusia ni]|uniref:Golgin subfamily A member 6-like protein 22 isoform X2 n=1 Tax=Trichoplusia ni TaxID=7111 RepID=A0A7E5VB82_TRINI|nr:golgin subfamily A member 6-like protein 22 isoform X2 [Trichoplusia ni]XP_026725545.1 golgin subfamily A member 6-like protein 22 isoform X2 [Trichoplusia ni]